jgi:hypothetical protein
MSDDAKNLCTGDAVQIECAGRSISGTVILASENGRSLLLGFEAILDGCVGLMPVLRVDDGSYQSVVTGIPIGLR